MSGTTEKTRLTLEKRHQLIDLNKEHVNFDIAFECRAVDATNDFEIIVVTQEQLNTVDLADLTMKKTKGGYISGNIIADEDKYQNYFLIMRSATGEPTDVDLEIRIKTIEPRQQQPQQPDAPMAAQVPAHDPFAVGATNDDVVCGSKGGNLVWVAVVLLVVAGVAGYYYYTRRKGCVGSTEDDTQSIASSASHHSAASSSDDSGILETLIQKSKK